MTAGWLYHMQTKKPWVHYASQSCGKTIPGAIYVALAHLFGTISKRPSLSAARYISFHEDKCTVYWRCHACHTELFFWPYRYYSLEAFENLLFLVWAQMLIPLTVLDTAPFRQDSAPLFISCDSIENVPNRKAGMGLALTLPSLGTLARVNLQLKFQIWQEKEEPFSWQPSIGTEECGLGEVSHRTDGSVGWR